MRLNLVPFGFTPGGGYRSAHQRGPLPGRSPRIHSGGGSPSAYQHRPPAGRSPRIHSGGGSPFTYQRRPPSGTAWSIISRMVAQHPWNVLKRQRWLGTALAAIGRGCAPRRMPYPSTTCTWFSQRAAASTFSTWKSPPSSLRTGGACATSMGGHRGIVHSSGIMLICFSGLRPTNSPQRVALGFMNNSAHYFHDRYGVALRDAKLAGVWRPGFYAGTVGSATTAQVKAFLRSQAGGEPPPE